MSLYESIAFVKRAVRFGPSISFSPWSNSASAFFLHDIILPNDSIGIVAAFCSFAAAGVGLGRDDAGRCTVSSSSDDPLSILFHLL
jgi:hypothetical protein